MHVQTYRENTLLKTTRDQLSHLLRCVCQAPGSILTEGEGNTVNATVINSLAWDSIMLQCVWNGGGKVNTSSDVLTVQ